MTRPSIETGIGIRAESISSRPPTPQMPSGFMTAKSMAENLCSSAIGPSFTKIHSTVRDDPGSSSDSRKCHLVSMLGIASQQVESVGQQGQDCTETVLGSGRAAGKVDDKPATCDAADTAAKGCKWSLLYAMKAKLLGYAGNEAVADRECGFGGYVALREASAACC